MEVRCLQKNQNVWIFFSAYLGDFLWFAFLLCEVGELLIFFFENPYVTLVSIMFQIHDLS